MSVFIPKGRRRLRPKGPALSATVDPRVDRRSLNQPRSGFVRRRENRPLSATRVRPSLEREHDVMVKTKGKGEGEVRSRSV